MIERVTPEQRAQERKREVVAVEPAPPAVTAVLVLGAVGCLLTALIVTYPLAFLLGFVGIVLGSVTWPATRGSGRPRRLLATGLVLCWLTLAPAVLLVAGFIISGELT